MVGPGSSAHLSPVRLISKKATIYAAIAAIALIASLALGALAATPTSSAGGLKAVHFAASIALLVIAYATDRQFTEIPALLRPSTVCVTAAVLASLSTGKLSNPEFPAYLSLWGAQVAGFSVAILFPRVTRRHQGRRGLGGRLPEYSEQLMRRVAIGLFCLSVLCAAAFFGRYGVPVLGENIEQGREDVAAAGTGLIRLGAYLSAPLAVVLVACRAQWSYLYPVIAGLILIGMANRAPLLYLVLPLVAVAASSTNNLHRTNARIAVTLVAVLAFVVGLGTYRVLSQADYAKYSEYRADIASGNIAGVAWTSLENYAEIVPNNAALTKRLVDEQRVPVQFGMSYLSLFTTALPGDHVPLDRTIKAASGASFLGGGTPPTLMGEGYANLWYVGTALSAFLLLRFTLFWAYRIQSARSNATSRQARLVAPLYGHLLAWTVLAQVAGLAGASTFAMASFLLLVGLLVVGRR